MLSQLPQELLSKAYLSGSGEPAWSAPDVLNVISWATESHFAVLGGEVWLPTTPGPTIPAPFFYTFETEQESGENWDDYVGRANNAANYYVKTFQWDVADVKHRGLDPFFNLTLSERAT